MIRVRVFISGEVQQKNSEYKNFQTIRFSLRGAHFLIVPRCQNVCERGGDRLLGNDRGEVQTQGAREGERRRECERGKDREGKRRVRATPESTGCAPVCIALKK